MIDQRHTRPLISRLGVLIGGRFIALIMAGLYGPKNATVVCSGDSRY